MAVQKEEKKSAKIAANEQAVLKAAAADDAYRTSFRCNTEGCSRAFLTERNRDLHSAKRCKPRLTREQKEQAALQKHGGQFETLRGAQHALRPDNDQLFGLDALCVGTPSPTIIDLAKYDEAELQKSYSGFCDRCTPEGCNRYHVPGARPTFKHNLDAEVEYSVSHVLRGCIDLVVYGGDNRELPGRGWATKEACARPSDSYSSELVAELRSCFDAVNRMNQFEIAKHLKQTFKIGRECLKPTQVQGWVSAEVARRKKGVVQKAGNSLVVTEGVADAQVEEGENEDEVAENIEIAAEVESDSEEDEESNDEGSGSESEGGEEFEVREIVDMREKDGVVEYKVLWVNYLDKEFSWEPKSNIEHAPKVLRAFEQKREGIGTKKRKRGAGMEFCGLQVLRDPACEDDQPAWWKAGLDEYMDRSVRLKLDNGLYDGKVTRFVMSAAPGETNVPAIFEVAGAFVLPAGAEGPDLTATTVHATKRQIDDGKRLFAQSQRSNRGSKRRAA